MKKTMKLIASLVVIFAFVAGICSPSFAAKKYRMTVGTGNSGGVFYVLGASMADVITKTSEMMEMTAQATTATSENLAFTNSHELDFGFSLFDVAHCAFTGTREYEKIGKLENLRIVVMGHIGINTQTVFKDSPIQNLGDLGTGKYKIAVSPGYTGFLLVKAALYGWGVELNPKAPVLTYTEMATALKDGTIDVMAYHGAHPASSMYDVASVKPLRILGHTPETLAKILEAYPYYVPTKVPGGMYNGIDEDVLAFGTPYCIVCHKDTPDEAVEEFVKILFNTDWTEYHSAGSYYKSDNDFYKQLYVNSDSKLIPFHPASKKYIESLGVGDLSSGF